MEVRNKCTCSYYYFVVVVGNTEYNAEQLCEILLEMEEGIDDSEQRAASSGEVEVNTVDSTIGKFNNIGDGELDGSINVVTSYFICHCQRPNLLCTDRF